MGHGHGHEGESIQIPTFIVQIWVFALPIKKQIYKVDSRTQTHTQSYIDRTENSPHGGPYSSPI